jgi:polar amino acid transport system substrate-binding protein
VKAVTLLALVVLPAAAQSALAPTGALRSAYLATNPAQVVKDPASGELRGTAIELTRELGRRLGVPVKLISSPNPAGVIDAVSKGEADIGFVAYNPERAGPVEFSQVYLLVQQTFLVPENSAVRSVADLDQPGRRLGAMRGDSIALYLARTLKQAKIVENTDASLEEAKRMLADGRIDAYGANRQRLTDLLRGASGLRLLPDDLYGVEQTIIVPKGNADRLKAVNQFLDAVRATGFLRQAMERSGVVGLSVAPAGEPAAKPK